MTESYENLLIENKAGVQIITINRPKALNALSIATVNDLQHAFNKDKLDETIRCMIITGAGDKAFIAGADIPELDNLNAQTGLDFSANGLRLLESIQKFPLPVIAAVNGFALGGGCELALVCDIRLASDRAKFGQPEVNLGVIPGFGGTQRLPRLVGIGKAMQMILTGEMISADEAHRIGLVDEVYPHDQLMEKVLQMAELIASKAPVAVQMSKECINKGLDMTLADGCELEKKRFGAVCGTKDKTEGIKAFLEKRRPKFNGN